MIRSNENPELNLNRLKIKTYNNLSDSTLREKRFDIFMEASEASLYRF